MRQYYINPYDFEKEMEQLFQQLSVNKIFLVCGNSFFTTSLYGLFNSICINNGIEVTFFKDFKTNPRYEDVKKGVEIFNQSRYDFILAVGGGSAIDVAKCIKIFAEMDMDQNFLRQKIVDNHIPFFAIPTTAGTGSESTQFAVIYVNSEKCSIEHESMLPKYVLLYADSLKTLSCYQKKVTVCDALSHSIESYWSVNSTPQSKRFSETAIQYILDYADDYLNNEDQSYEKMLLAANCAGQAINITKTTAAHAMSYKLTTILDIPHGHAVMLCLPEVWEYMYVHLKDCIDTRGQQFLQETLEMLSHCLRQSSPQNAIQFLKHLRSKWQLNLSVNLKEEQLLQLVNSVNIERLSNFPIAVSKENLMSLYQKILSEKM